MSVMGKTGMSKTNSMDMKKDFRQRLLGRFQKQEQFTSGYSPLFSRLCGIVGEWLLQDGDPIGKWLVTVTAGRASFDVPLLLMAGLHKNVLAKRSETKALAAYYATADGHESHKDPDLPQVLRQAISLLQEELTAFIQTASVQTNETGRGLCWLLPLLYTPWQKVHLVDLGASAGLNLLADKRSYMLVDGDSTKEIASLGQGSSAQFAVKCSGPLTPPTRTTEEVEVVSRIGCDKVPFYLQTKEDEYTLASFIWGDQQERMIRLLEGIAVLRDMVAKGMHLQLYPADIPQELDAFLTQHIPTDPACPVVLYNTYLTNYLTDKGRSLPQRIHQWAAQQQRDILWLQMEISRNELQPPHKGWVLWQANLWQQGIQQKWNLAWCHPHGSPVHWLPGMEQWARFWQNKTGQQAV